ncbi:MAG: ABC transporter permease, partial [Syntrophobacterales bacterium]|nr:ABC transporter permease [Syntrophobacterales bacterium]
QFIAPALIAINIMNNAFYENTYGSYVRMYYQKTFEGMMATPLTVAEIIAGEIVWGAFKAVLATILMVVVISFFGLIRYPEGLLLIPIAFLGGLFFASLGRCLTSIVPHIELFNIPFFLFITPMYLFGGTFFPLQNLPLWVQQVASFLPLTHLVHLCRAFAGGHMESAWAGSLFYILCLTPVLFLLAIWGMHRRLIK